MSDYETVEQTKLLSAADIFAADDLELTLVDVPEWGGSVYLRAMTGLERDTFETASLKYSNTKDPSFLRNFRAKFVLACVVDADGKPLFKENQLDKIASKSAKVLDRLSEKIQELSGIEKKKDKEAESDIEKN